MNEFRMEANEKLGRELTDGRLIWFLTCSAREVIDDLVTVVCALRSHSSNLEADVKTFANDESISYCSFTDEDVFNDFASSWDKLGSQRLTKD